MPEVHFYHFFWNMKYKTINLLPIIKMFVKIFIRKITFYFTFMNAFWPQLFDPTYSHEAGGKMSLMVNFRGFWFPFTRNTAGLEHWCQFISFSASQICCVKSQVDKHYMQDFCNLVTSEVATIMRYHEMCASTFCLISCVKKYSDWSHIFELQKANLNLSSNERARFKFIEW